MITENTPQGLRVETLVEAEDWLKANVQPTDVVITGIPRHLAWYADLGGHVRLERGRERILNPLPLFHMNSQAVSATAAILTANCLAQPERFSPSRWWKDVAASGATVIHYLGVMPPMLLNQPVTPEERGHRVKFGLGAGVLEAGEREQFVDRPAEPVHLFERRVGVAQRVRALVDPPPQQLQP